VEFQLGPESPARGIGHRWRTWHFCIIIVHQRIAQRIIMHTATLRATGGSISVSLPRQLLRSLGLEAGAQVAVTMEAGRLVLSPARPRYTLADLTKGMKPGDMPTAEGWDDMPPAGREAW
jgi:antitoxin component of MazEF toxin-antitoxin module